jgi:hypothetical protein
LQHIRNFYGIIIATTTVGQNSNTNTAHVDCGVMKQKLWLGCRDAAIKLGKVQKKAKPDYCMIGGRTIRHFSEGWMMQHTKGAFW